MRRLTTVVATAMVALMSILAAAGTAAANPAPRATGTPGNLAIVAGHNASVVAGSATANPIEATGAVTDASGDVYVADASSHVVEKITPAGQMTVVAGISGRGGEPVPGPATSSPLGFPAGVALDGSGDLFIADRADDVIDEVSAAGTLQVIAGTPGQSGAPTPGPATASKLSGPGGVAVDAAGDVYIADTQNSVLEEVAVGGQLSIVAGKADTPGAPTAGAASGSLLRFPQSVAVGASGSIFIGDTSNDVVEKIKAGALSIVAGTPGSAGDPADGFLNAPQGVVASGSTLYIADTGNDELVKTGVNGNGGITVLAGIGTSAGTPVPGPATSSPLNDPAGVAVDAAGTLYIADQRNFTVDAVTSAGALSIFAGEVPNGAQTPGPATASKLNGPTGVATDAAGDLYIADTTNHVVEKVTPSGTLSVVAGSGAAGTPVAGAATSSPLEFPEGLAVDGAGDLYIADAIADVVLEVTPAGQLSVVAGIAGQSGTPAPGTATQVHLGEPTGVALDSAGNLYIADLGAAVVEKVSGGQLSIVAGTPSTTGKPVPGTATSSPLATPESVAISSAGDLYIGDPRNHVIEKVSGGQLSVLAGTAGTGGAPTPGAANASLLSDPTGIALDAGGDLYVADPFESELLKITPGGTLSIAAGAALQASLPTAGPVSASQLYGPSSVATDAAGNVYVGDEGASDVEEIFGPARATTTSVACVPASVLFPGGSTACTATVTDTGPAAATAPAGTVGFTAAPASGTFGPAAGCTLAATGSATAACSVTFTPSAAGSYTVTGSYGGEATHAASMGTSAAVLAVSQAPTPGKAKLGRVKVKQTTANVPVTCTGAAACAVTLKLTVVETLNGKRVTAVTAAAAKGKKPKTKHKTVTLATRKVTVPAGKTVTVTLSLNRTGKTLLKRRRTLKVKLTLVQGKTTVQKTVTFKQPKAKTRKSK